MTNIKTNTEVVKIGKHYFRWEDGIVSKVVPATADHLKDNEEWMEKYGDPLWDIKDGFVEFSSAGLCRENWEDKEARTEYLLAWIDELEEESRILTEQFLKWG